MKKRFMCLPKTFASYYWLRRWGKKSTGARSWFPTGCKVVCLDEQGNFLHNYTPSIPIRHKMNGKAAGATLKHLVDSYDIEAIGMGNGTAGRETETTGT